MNRRAGILTIGAFMLFNAAAMAATPKLPALEPVKFNPPKGSRFVLDNGMVVYMLKDNTLPVIHMTAAIKTGKIYDPADKIGLADLSMSLLKDGGTAKYKPEEIDKKLEFLGASVEPAIQLEEARLNLFSLKKDFSEVFDIFADVLMAPAFDAEKTKIKKDEFLEVIRRRNDDPARAASREALRRFYGPDHPYGWRMENSTIEPMTPADLAGFHARYFAPNNIIIAVSGDYASDEAMLASIKEKFGAWGKKEVSFPAIPPVKFPGKRLVYFTEKDVSQVFISMMMPGIKRHDDTEYPLNVMNELLGGGIQSRLGNEVRSKRGLAYSVYSYFAKRPDTGFINASCGTKPETYSQALDLILAQFELLRKEPVGADELKRSKGQIINSFVFRFPTAFDIVSERALYEYYKYAPDYLDTYVDKMAAVQSKDLLQTAQRLYDTAPALIYVIGNSKKLDKPLSTFGEVVTVQED